MACQVYLAPKGPTTKASAVVSGLAARNSRGDGVKPRHTTNSRPGRVGVHLRWETGPSTTASLGADRRGAGGKRREAAVAPGVSGEGEGDGALPPEEMAAGRLPREGGPPAAGRGAEV